MQPGSGTFINHLAVVLIAAVTALLSASCLQTGHDSGDDFALYVLEAKAITEGSLGELAETNRFCMEHSMLKPGPALYPVGYPLLLAPVYAAGGLDFFALKWINVLLLAGCIPLFFCLFSFHGHQTMLNAIVVILAVWQMEIIAFPDQLLSEISFLFFSLLALWLMQRPLGNVNGMLTGVAIFTAYLVRDAGFFLLPALAVYQYAQFKNKQKGISWKPWWTFLLLFILLYTLIPYGGWYHWRKMYTGFDLPLWRDNLIYYSNTWMQLLFKYDTIWLRAIAALTVTAGMISNLRRHPHLVVFAAGLAGMTILWPVQIGVRALIPMMPFVVFFLVTGVMFLADRIRVHKTLVLGLLVVLTVFLTYRNIMFIRERNETVVTNEIYTPETIELYTWLKQNTPADAVIGFDKPRALLLFTGRRSIHTGAGHFEGSVADWLLLEKPGIQPPGITKIFETKSFCVYRKQ